MPVIEYFAGATFTRYCPNCKGERKHSSLFQKGDKPHTLKDPESLSARIAGTCIKEKGSGIRIS